jgi:PAS domain S-box-containing protein
MAIKDSHDRFESAQFLQSVLEAVPAFVVLMDEDDRVRYINRVQPGLTLADVIGRCGYDFLSPEYHALHRRAVEDARRLGGSHGFLVRGLGPDGGVAFYESRAIGVDEADGKRLVYIVALDVTEHVARAEALRESEEKLRLTVEASRIGLWSWDLVTNQVEWNARMFELTGSAEALDGVAYVERCVHPEDRARMREEVHAMLRGVARHPAHRIVREDGEVRWVAAVGSYSRGADGQPARLRGGFIDITEQRQTEERLRQVQKLDALGNLTAGVAHNFNNALAVILPAIEVALRDPALAPGGATQRLLEEASKASRVAAQLVVQLMASAGQRAAAAQKPIDLSNLLESVVSMCRQTFDRRYAIDFNAEPSGPWVVADSAALEQVFLNLILNARDALHASAVPAPRITVAVEHAPGPSRAQAQARVTVIDNGPGLSELAQRHLFEPFFTTKPTGQGAGLGLWTSRGTVREHGGSLEITSRRGHGTRCEVVLPCAPDAMPVAQDAASVEPAIIGRILVVDDEPAVRAVMQRALELYGHTVEEAESAIAAAAKLDGGFSCDLVLLDRSMPGWPAGRAVAELRARTAAPILFFTGQDLPAVEAALVEEVLLKPLAPADLQAAIAKWLNRPR